MGPERSIAGLSLAEYELMKAEKAEAARKLSADISEGNSSLYDIVSILANPADHNIPTKPELEELAGTLLLMDDTVEQQRDIDLVNTYHTLLDTAEALHTPLGTAANFESDLEVKLKGHFKLVPGFNVWGELSADEDLQAYSKNEKRGAIKAAGISTIFAELSYMLFSAGSFKTGLLFGGFAFLGSLGTLGNALAARAAIKGKQREIEDFRTRTEEEVGLENAYSVLEEKLPEFYGLLVEAYKITLDIDIDQEPTKGNLMLENEPRDGFDAVERVKDFYRFVEYVREFVSGEETPHVKAIFMTDPASESAERLAPSTLKPGYLLSEGT